MVSYQNQLRSLKQTILSGGGGLAAVYTVWWLAKCLLEIVFTEMGAYLK